MSNDKENTTGAAGGQEKSEIKVEKVEDVLNRVAGNREPGLMFYRMHQSGSITTPHYLRVTTRVRHVGVDSDFWHVMKEHYPSDWARHEHEVIAEVYSRLGTLAKEIAKILGERYPDLGFIDDDVAESISIATDRVGLRVDKVTGFQSLGTGIVRFKDNVIFNVSASGFITESPFGEDGLPPEAPIWEEYVTKLFGEGLPRKAIMCWLWQHYSAARRREWAFCPALVIYGPAGTGKSYFTDVLFPALTGGSEAAVNLKRLLTEARFNSQIGNSYAIVASDMARRRWDDHEGDSMCLKALVANRDFDVEVKRMDGTITLPLPRGIALSLNNDQRSLDALPDVTEQSWMDKVLIIATGSVAATGALHEEYPSRKELRCAFFREAGDFLSRCRWEYEHMEDWAHETCLFRTRPEPTVVPGGDLSPRTDIHILHTCKPVMALRELMGEVVKRYEKMEDNEDKPKSLPFIHKRGTSSDIIRLLETGVLDGSLVVSAKGESIALAEANRYLKTRVKIRQAMKQWYLLRDSEMEWETNERKGARLKLSHEFVEWVLEEDT